VDKETGHRVWRLTKEAGSTALYFNYNAFSADGKWMAYSAPDGVRVLDLVTFESKMMRANDGRKKARLIAVGRKNGTIYVSVQGEDDSELLLTIDISNARIVRQSRLQPGMKIDSINADETLAAGTFERRPSANENGKFDVMYPGTIIQAPNKGQMMQKRLAARIPLSLFTVDLRSGDVKEILRSEEWLNHLQFSPTDPTLLMYCHEGPWQKVDRIWTIRTDGGRPKLMHQRTMLMEITGHEFWSHDGKTIWYDWQFPKGKTFFLAGVGVDNGRRTAFPIARDDWAIHFNASDDGSIFVGDGGDASQVARAENGRWISLFTPKGDAATDAANSEGYWQYSNLQVDHLVNMKAHDYKLEPNVRISPDKKFVIFRSNLFGPNYVFAVEIEQTKGVAADAEDTTALAARFKNMH
jgi:oligogalacturonide lyase